MMPLKPSGTIKKTRIPCTPFRRNNHEDLETTCLHFEDKYLHDEDNVVISMSSGAIVL